MQELIQPAANEKTSVKNNNSNLKIPSINIQKNESVKLVQRHPKKESSKASFSDFQEEICSGQRSFLRKKNVQRDEQLDSNNLNLHQKEEKTARKEKPTAFLNETASMIGDVAMKLVSKKLIVETTQQNAARKSTSVFSNRESDSEIIGFKKAIFEKYKAIKKIENLYTWQKQFLNDPRIINGENVLLTAQTGGGKTLIAEIVMLREICNKNCNAFFVLPFVALVQEKILAFKALADAFNVRVEEYAAHKGRIPPLNCNDRRVLYICTIEKANLLINALMEKDKQKNITLLVVDEVHMIGETGRGATLESLISKFMAAFSGQIITMSATIGNASQVAQFLNAFHFHNAHRPVDLKQYITVQKSIFQITNTKEIVRVGALINNDPADPDGVLELAFEYVPEHSVLIFCSSRTSCENLCLLLCSNIKQKLAIFKKNERAMAIEELNAECDNQASQCLIDSIKVGVAYHHAGLLSSEREVVESAFRSGVISIVCATTTLAVGVNLPARRVIIRSSKVGSDFMTKSQYLQMAGRAGRPGFSEIGECFVIGNEEKEQIRKIIINDPIPNCDSQFVNQSIESFIIDLIGLGFSKYEKLKQIIKSTLYSIQNHGSVDAIFGETLQKLEESKFVIKLSNLCFDEYGLDFFGRGKFYSGIHPEEIPELLAHFSCYFEQGISFKTHFSLIFVNIPFDIKVTVNWEVYRSQYLKLEVCDRRMFGDPKNVETAIHQHQAQKSLASTTEMRLYVALLINILCQRGMNSVYECAEIFKVQASWIQQTYESICQRIQALGRLSEHLSTMWPLKGLLPDLVKYMRSAGNEKIALLMSIDGITRSMAFVLINTTHLNTIGAISKATVEELRGALNGKLRKNLAEKIILNAKCVLRDAIDEKREEIAAMGGIFHSD